MLLPQQKNALLEATKGIPAEQHDAEVQCGLGEGLHPTHSAQQMEPPTLESFPAPDGVALGHVWPTHGVIQ